MKNKETQRIEINLMQMRLTIFTPDLHFSKNEINKSFLIVVYGSVKRQLVGVDGLVRIAGLKKANKALFIAFSSKGDKCTVKFRSGLRIDFYVH